ncbi:hypothetical protein JL720_8620 [Aureococcus anophagefferens]|nr:hypothetical protein JL720_8620 [Aureococcus anophagefferens]
MSVQLIKQLRAASGARMVDCKAAIEACGNVDDAFEWLRKKGIARAAKLSDRVAEHARRSACDRETSSTDRRVRLRRRPRRRDAPALRRPRRRGVRGDGRGARRRRCGASANGEPCADAAAALSAHVGERVVVRRAAPRGDVVGAYAHAVGPALASRRSSRCRRRRRRDAAGLDAVAKAAAMHAVAARPVYLDAGRVPADVLAKERAVLVDQLADSGKPENIVEKIVAARLAKFAGEKSLAGQAHVVEGGKATVAAVVAKALPGFEVSGFALCTVGGDDAAE